MENTHSILSLLAAIKGGLSEFGLFSVGHCCQRALSSKPTPYQVLKIHENVRQLLLF